MLEKLQQIGEKALEIVTAGINIPIENIPGISFIINILAFVIDFEYGFIYKVFSFLPIQQEIIKSLSVFAVIFFNFAFFEFIKSLIKNRKNSFSIKTYEVNIAKIIIINFIATIIIVVTLNDKGSLNITNNINIVIAKITIITIIMYAIVMIMLLNYEEENQKQILKK